MNKLLLPILGAIVILALAGPAAAQDGSTFADQDGTTFADQFFIARKTNAGGEKSVEVLGSLIIWFLLLLSVVSIGLIGNMALTNQRKTIVSAETVAQVRRLLESGEYRQALDLAQRDGSFFGQIMRAALSEASHGFAAVIRALEQTSDELTTRRLRRLEYLNVLGQVSPMIGLFGTVYGMILAFQAIVTAGGNADPVLLAGGISTALTTTFWGLIVAIPALAGYGIIRNKIDELTTEGTVIAEELINRFRPRPRGKSPKTPGETEPETESRPESLSTTPDP